MIQRIQTIYLLIAAIAMALPMLLLPAFINFRSGADIYALHPDSIRFTHEGTVAVVMQAYPLVGSMAFALLLGIYAIMQYTDRRFQIKLVRICQIVYLLFFGMFTYYVYQVGELVNHAPDSSKPSLWLLLPLVGFAATFMAVRGIKKDDELIRSADRLR